MLNLLFRYFYKIIAIFICTIVGVPDGQVKDVDVSQLRLTDEAVLSDVAKRHPEWSPADQEAAAIVGYRNQDKPY